MTAPKKLTEEEVGLLEESRRVMLWNVNTFPATAAPERKTWQQRATVIESAATRLRYVEARLEEAEGMLRAMLGPNAPRGQEIRAFLSEDK